MQLYIDNLSLTNYQLNKRFTYQFELKDAITVDRIDFDMVGVDEFKPSNEKSILNSSPVIEASIYKDDGGLLTAGELTILNYDQMSGISKIQVIPKLDSILSQYITFSYGIESISTPCEVLWNLFQQIDATDYIDLSSYNRLNALFKSYSVYAGVDFNLTAYENTIYDVINNFAKSFVVDIWVQNNKLRFWSPLFTTLPAYALPENMIISYKEDYSDNEIYNDWKISSPNFELALKDYNPMTAVSSRKKYGFKTFDISPTLWIVESNSKPLSGWLQHALAAAYSYITAKQNPYTLIDIEVVNKWIEEIDLGDRFTFLSNTWVVKKLQRSDETGRITAYKV
jgi:hypothetical protein